MKRSDWLLVLLHLPGHTSQENEPMDRLRIIKTLFLLGREVKDIPDFYEFSPYLYGPFSLDIYKDLDELIANGCVRQKSTLPMNWDSYSLTAQGIVRAQKTSREIPSPTIEKMKEIKIVVTGLSFLDLLKHVYSKYPEYAKDSIITIS